MAAFEYFKHNVSKASALLGLSDQERIALTTPDRVLHARGSRPSGGGHLRRPPQSETRADLSMGGATLSTGRSLWPSRFFSMESNYFLWENVL